MRQRPILFLALIAAMTMASSAASAGGCGWHGGCGWYGGCRAPFYASGQIACDIHPFYVVNHGPYYSGPAIVTYPTYTPRAYPYVHGGCYRGGCYGVSYIKPVMYYEHRRYHHRPIYRVRRHHSLPLK